MDAVDRVELVSRVGQVLVGGVHRKAERGGDVFAGEAVGREAQAFDLALRDERGFDLFLHALARDLFEEREAAGVNVAKQFFVERHVVA